MEANPPKQRREPDGQVVRRNFKCDHKFPPNVRLVQVVSINLIAGTFAADVVLVDKSEQPA